MLGAKPDVRFLIRSGRVGDGPRVGSKRSDRDNPRLHIPCMVPVKLRRTGSVDRGNCVTFAQLTVSTTL